VSISEILLGQPPFNPITSSSGYSVAPKFNKFIHCQSVFDFTGELISASFVLQEEIQASSYFVGCGMKTCRGPLFTSRAQWGDWTSAVKRSLKRHLHFTGPNECGVWTLLD